MPELRDQAWDYMINNCTSHIESQELNYTTLAEETINALDIGSNDEELIFDLAVDIEPTLEKLGFVA